MNITEPSENIINDQSIYRKEVDPVHQALVRRRHFSLRLQLFIGFLIVFLFAVAVAVLILITTNKVEDKLRVLEIVDNYVIEIQQARRFEKNFFLYGTNLSDAL
ncbi:MAG: two-component sensor histidine kinase, partial [Deltaproteobacteria bacterium]|nr:two-component sensor histidine kinase [Deltaproteobacteria bacterium]